MPTLLAHIYECCVLHVERVESLLMHALWCSAGGVAERLEGPTQSASPENYRGRPVVVQAAVG